MLILRVVSETRTRVWEYISVDDTRRHDRFPSDFAQNTANDNKGEREKSQLEHKKQNIDDDDGISQSDKKTNNNLNRS